MIKTKNIKIKLEDAKYGWTSMKIFINRKQIIRIAISGVFNPFYAISDALLSLNKKKRKGIYIDIEEEGPTTEFNLKNTVNGIKFELERNSRRNQVKKQTYLIPKNQFITAFKKEMQRYAQKNREELKDTFYDLTVDTKKLSAIS